MKRRTYRAFILLAILAIVAAFALAIVLRPGRSQSNQEATNPKDAAENSASGEEEDSADYTIPKGSTFEIHFFDVGEADSALVMCDGEYMLIDGGYPRDSQFLYSYLKQHSISHLSYVVCSHAHEDHSGGLAGALNYATVGTAYAPVKEYDNRAFSSFVKYVEKQGKEMIIPSAGDTFTFGNATVTIMGPVDSSLAKDNENNTSIVLKVTYGNTSFLFTGDAEEDEELSIVKSGYDIRSTVLKVAHHGSYTSTSESFLDAVKPDYCIISVGKDNLYGHPHDAVLDRIEECGAKIYRTDELGEIVCRSDGKTVFFSNEE